MGIKRPIRLLAAGLAGLAALWAAWPAPPLEVSTFGPLPLTPQDGLETAYAPLLILDSREAYSPIAVAPWLAQAEFRSAYFARHGRGHLTDKFYPPQALRFVGSHVQVYPAWGTHGAYPTPGTFALPLALGPWQPQDRSDGQGRRLATWEHPLLPLDQQAWAAFGGRWGAIRKDACNLLEKLTEAANDGPFAPGHGTKAPLWLTGDWDTLPTPQESR